MRVCWCPWRTWLLYDRSIYDIVTTKILKIILQIDNIEIIWKLRLLSDFFVIIFSCVFLDDFVSIRTLLLPMYSYLLLFARVQKVTKKTHQTQCYVLRPHHCFVYEVGDHPSFGRDPARQPMSSIAIDALLADSHSAFDNDSVMQWRTHESVSL